MFTEPTEYTSSRAQSFCAKDLLICAQSEILRYALNDVPEELLGLDSDYIVTVMPT